MDVHIDVFHVLEFSVVWGVASLLRGTCFPYLTGPSEYLFKAEIYGLYLLGRYLSSNR